MDEQEKQQLGDGSDDFSQGMQNIKDAAQKSSNAGGSPAAQQGADPSGANPAQGGTDAANQAAQKGAEAGANAAQKGAEAGAEAAAKGAETGANAAANAAAAAKAGAEGGAAVAEIASGTAAGGWVGAAIMAAWSLRHTLFKILICLCLAIMFLAAMVVSLPSIIFNYVFRTDPASVGVAASYDIHDLFEEMSVAVADCVTAGYDHSIAAVEKIISDGGYDYEYSMQALINYGATSAEYDISYVLAAYSVAMEQKGTKKQDMVNKLTAVKDKMFLVTYEAKETTITVPPETEGGEATTVTVKYVACTIHPFDQSVILKAFSIDPAAQYNQFNITNGAAITNMANALKLTMYGSIVIGGVPPITDIELAAFVANLTCSQTRKDLITTALSLVGRVPYFWGGKSSAGWNSEWNTPKLVTSVGSSSTGTIRPYGLDCTGYTDWVFKTTLGVSIGAGSWNQWDNSTSITVSQLRPGDLGFMAIPGTVTTNHVLMYAGKDASGNLLWVHCEWGTGVHMNSPTYVKYYRRPNGIDWGD